MLQAAPVLVGTAPEAGLVVALASVVAPAAVAAPPASRPTTSVPPASAAIDLRDRQCRSDIGGLDTRISECLHDVKTRPDAGLARQR